MEANRSEEKVQAILEMQILGYQERHNNINYKQHVI